MNGNYGNTAQAEKTRGGLVFLSPLDHTITISCGEGSHPIFGGKIITWVVMIRKEFWCERGA